VKRAAESNEAAEELLALGPSVIPALRDYIEQYPDTVNVSRESRWEWRAARRCERILRLLEEQRLRETEGTESDAAEPFIRATGLPAARGRIAFEEALIPNRALMEAAAEAGGMDWNTLGEPERAAFRERFEAVFDPVAERWKKGVRLDAFANPAKPAYPMSDVVIGDLLALLFARTQAPDAWTLDWYVDASRLLANWRDFEKTNPRLSRLELTLKEKDTALTAALEVLIHKAAEKSETITGRTAAAWVALANRMQPMALDLAADIVAKDLPAFRQRERTAPDPASGKPIGRLEQSGPRLKLTTEANIQPGEFLVAARDGQFVSWLKLTKDGEHVTWQTAHRRVKPQSGDEVLLPPDEALLPSEKDAALQTWFATVHILLSYGKTEEHARHLRQFVAVDGKVSVFSGMYRIRDFAMMGLLQLTGQDEEKYETKTVPGVCPWSWPGGLKLLEFGEGEQWKAAQEMMDAWFDAHAAESEPGQELPDAGKLSVEKTSNLKIGVSNAQFQLTTRRKAAQSDKHFHLIDPQILGDEDAAVKDGSHRVIPGPNTVFVIDAEGQLYGMGLNSGGSLGLSEEITASRDLRPIFDKPVRQVASHSHTLIVTQDGELWATGTNSHGQLGLGDMQSRFAPQLVVDDGVTKAAAGKWFSMFLKKDGTLWAMGADMAQIVGVGESNPGGGASQYVEGRDIDRPIILARQVTDVAACGNLAYFLKQDGSLWATGLPSSDKRPQRVADGPIRMAVGDTGVVLFVKEDGSLWSIGAGWARTLGTGDKEPRTKPFRIEPKDVIDVSIYGNNAVYLKDDGTAWGMGENRRADLGLGHDREVLKPERLSIDGRPTDSVTDVWTVGAHTLILTEDGQLWGMGDNYYRQLQRDPRYFNNPNQNLRRKYGLREWPAIPVRLFKDRTVTQASGNGACTLIVDDQGVLWTVGWHPTVGMTGGLYELERDQRLESRQPRRLALRSRE
jgi:alpha-tubulin suppressor-like RCC1 family protein